MKIEWKPDFAVGVLEIDGQHRELFARLDRLVQAIAAGHGNEKIAETFDFLEEYTHRHFRDEEALQLRYHYPHYEMHRAEHQHFTDTLTAIRADFAATGSQEVAVKRTNQALHEWLINHICNTDKALAAFLAQDPQPD